MSRRYRTHIYAKEPTTFRERTTNTSKHSGARDCLTDPAGGIRAPKVPGTGFVA